MKPSRSLTAFGTVGLLACLHLPSGAMAQDAITPVPQPSIGSAPSGPSNAQETHDQIAIEELMRIVELSRLVGGGITQMFSAIQSQKQAVDNLLNAHVGPRQFPLNNSPGDIAARSGGTGLDDMAQSALDGAPKGPDDVVAALAILQATYNLDKAFALKDDPDLGKRLVAQATAQGAVAAATGEASYRRANAGMGRIDGYLTALAASPDLKTSIDLNTRVMLELTQQLNENLRTQAALTNTAGSYFMILGAEMSQPDFLEGLKTFNR